MPYHHNQEIHDHIAALAKNNNEYTFYALRQFAKAKFAEIEEQASELHLNDELILLVQHQVLSMLEQMDFTEIYSKKRIKFHPTSEYDFDPNDFKKYIYKTFPSMENTKLFILENIRHVDDERQNLLDQIHKVKRIINHYKRENKQHLVKDFNHKIDNFYSSLRGQSEERVKSELKNGLDDILNQLQKVEDSYYSPLFFARARKSNSSLQVRINDAREHIKKNAP